MLCLPVSLSYLIRGIITCDASRKYFFIISTSVKRWHLCKQKSVNIHVPHMGEWTRRNSKNAYWLLTNLLSVQLTFLPIDPWPIHFLTSWTSDWIDHWPNDLSIYWHINCFLWLNCSHFAIRFESLENLHHFLAFVNLQFLCLWFSSHCRVIANMYS